MRTFKEIFKKSAAAKVLGLFAAVLSFSLVLSLVFATSVIAFADEESPKTQRYHGNPTLGSATEHLNTLSTYGKPLTAADFNSTDDATVWTVTEVFEKGKASATNHEVYTAMDLGGNAGDDEKNILIQYYHDSEHVFKIGTYCNGWDHALWNKDWERNWNMMSANYEIGDFLKSIVRNPNFTVTFEMTMTSTGENLNTTFVGAWLTDEEKTGQDNYQMVYAGNHDGAEDGYPNTVLWHKGSGDGENTTDKDGWSHNKEISTAITLTEDMNYITIFAGAWYQNGSTSYKMTTINEMSFIFTITYTGEYGVETPTLSDTDGYAVHNENYTVAANKKWLTGNDYSTTVSFNNDVFGVFGKGYSLYGAMKCFKSVGEFQGFQGTIENDEEYKNITAENYEEDYGLDAFYNPSFGNGNTDTTLNLWTNEGAGLRAIYLWVVDPAGTASDINSYYVLVDATDYGVSASIGNTAAGSVSVTSGATVKRGQDITVKVTLNEGYVPYRFKNGDDILLLSNDTANKELEPAGSAYDDLISVEKSGNVYTVKYEVKDDSTLGQIETSFDFTVSARKVVTPTVAASYEHPYDNKAPATSNYLSGVNDSTALSLFTFTYYNSDNTLLGSNGKTAPVNAGSYKVEISFPSNNDDYVLGSSLTNRVALTIEKKVVTVTPSATSTKYGENINLRYTSNFSAISGETLDVALKLDTESWGGIVGAGSYNIVFDGTPSVKKNGTASGNFSVVLNATPVKHTVTKKYVTVTPKASESVYGEKITLDCTHDFAAVDGETIEVVLKLKSANLNGVVGVNSYEIVLDEATVVKKGETTSKNYAVVLSSTPVKHTVTKKYVTVTPNATNSTFGDAFTLGYTDDFAAVNGESLVGSLKLENEQKTGNYTTVGEYAIIQDTQFAVLTSAGQPSGNYTVTFTAGVKHTVTKRTVQLTVNSTSAIKHGETPNPGKVVPKYTLANVDDKAFETLVKNAVTGKFILTASGNGTEGIDTEKYTEYYAYTVTLDEIDNDNLIITLAPNATHTIYVSVPGRVHEVETETGDATVTVENGTTANKLVVEEIDESGSADNELWNTVNAGVPEIDKNAELISIVTIGLYLDDEPIAVDGVLTVNIAIPEVAGSLENMAIYVLNANGELELLEDYTVDEGRLEYTTDYLGSIVFLNIKEEVTVDPDPTPGPDDPNPNPNPNPNPGPDDPNPNPGPDDPTPGPDDPNPDDPNEDDPNPTPNPDPSEEGGDQPAKGMPAWQIALIAVIAALVVIGGAVTVIILVRKKSKQKES